MAQKHTLSIIIPIYKYEENCNYISELLIKINNQKESQFNIIEIILVNDSPDFKLESIFRSVYINIDIKIINNEKNCGQAFSRNIGKESSIGEYLHFIDQDDLIELDFYSNISNIKDIILANCYLFNESKSVLHMKYSKQIILSLFRNISSLKFFLIFDNIVLSPGQMIINRNVFDCIGDFPLLSNYGSDDYGFMYKLSFQSLEFSFSPKAFFYHRLHPSQGKNNLNMSASKIEFLNNYSIENTVFKKLCFYEAFPFNLFKKVAYLLFYNRLI
jgi:GT2 family glycosyltransferase